MADKDRHRRYVRYSERCFTMALVAMDEDSRAVQREMAAEWLKLADAVLHPLKRNDAIQRYSLHVTSAMAQ